MWKDYSSGFIKKNRASSISVIIAAFISALFLSLICSLFYNYWNYETESIVLSEGDWQGRITGTFEEGVVSDIANFANVKKAVINEELSDDQKSVFLGENAKRFYGFKNLPDIPYIKNMSEEPYNKNIFSP